MAIHIVSRGLSSGCMLTGLMIIADGWLGEAVAALMAIVALMLLVDLVINDLLSARFAWRWSVQKRHRLYALVSFCYLVPPFVLAPALGNAWNAYLFYIAMAGFGLVLAFRDQLIQRDRSATCKS
ncbi:MAG: hypothetical protein VB131_04750 [Burkholderia gladioli]